MPSVWKDDIVFPLENTYHDIGHVKSVVGDTGWYPGTWTCEYTRYAWSNRDERFESQHESAMSRLCGVWDVRNHVRYWEFGDHVSMQSHFETQRSHTIISYDDAEDEIRTIFTNCGLEREIEVPL